MTIPEPTAVPAVSTAPATVTLPAERASRRGIRLGMWSLISGIIAPVWAMTALFLDMWSGSGEDLPDWATVPSHLIALLAGVVVPVAVIAAIVLGIFAMVRNVRPGVIMSVIGIAVNLLAVIGVVALIAFVLPGVRFT